MFPQWLRDIYSIYRAQNDDYPQNNDRLKMQNAMSNHNIPYSKVFKTYCVEYASDPRFKIQGARENFALHLESWILRIRGVFNRIRFEHVWIRPIFVRGESFVLKDKEETYDLQARPRSHDARRPAAEISEKGMGTNASQEPMPSQSPDWEDSRGYHGGVGGGGYHIYIYIYIYICVCVCYYNTYVVMLSSIAIRKHNLA